MKNPAQQKPMSREAISQQIECLFNQDVSDHLEALHSMFAGYARSVVAEAQETPPSEREFDHVSFTYARLRDLLREMVSVEKEFNRQNRK
jgi:hypothetical protein